MKNRTLATANDMLADAPVRVAGILPATDADMAAVNALAGTELSSDAIYLFEPVVTTDALDAYFTRMAESSLANYVQDAAQGNPLMTGHDTMRLAIGRSFAGVLEESNGVRCVRLRDYMLKDYRVDGNSTDDIARGIEAGVNRDMSISFGGPDHWCRCGICGLNLFDENCPHCPGVVYGEERAFAWVEDARMIEHSIVFSGATPGAVVRKARSLAASGMLAKSDISFLEETWRVRLADSTTIPFPSKCKTGLTQEERDMNMNAKTFLEKLRGFFGGNKRMNDVIDDLRGSVSEDASIESILDTLGKGLRAEAEFAGEVRALGLESIEAVKALSERAKLGDLYRADLVAETLAAGVRAQGEGFDKPLWERILNEPSRSIDDIKTFRGKFDDEAKAVLGNGGRQGTSSGMRR
jgi:hypothetical protein